MHRTFFFFKGLSRLLKGLKVFGFINRYLYKWVYRHCITGKVFNCLVTEGAFTHYSPTSYPPTYTSPNLSGVGKSCSRLPELWPFRILTTWILIISYSLSGAGKSWQHPFAQMVIHSNQTCRDAPNVKSSKRRPTYINTTRFMAFRHLLTTQNVLTLEWSISNWCIKHVITAGLIHGTQCIRWPMLVLLVVSDRWRDLKWLLIGD